MIQKRLHDYLELTKPRLSLLVLWSAMVGFLLANKGTFDYSLMALTLFGTMLVAAGSMTLNQWMEREHDARMERTLNRPLPGGRLSNREALLFGLIISGIGLGLLFWKVNGVAAFIALLTTLSYLIIYTPLKRTTSLCTLAGAIPGALPPLIGWTAVTGALPPPEAWLLAAIIFLWQMPHFLAIAWIYRKDFQAAGFRMLSCEDPEGTRVAKQMILYSCALLPVSLMPTVLGMTGKIYFVTAFILGILFVAASVACYYDIHRKAKILFRVSILYLTLILIFMVTDKING